VKPDYADIKKAVRPDKPVLWYDTNGVPRFEPFRPEMCSVYCRAVALMEIACQSCGQRFIVASEGGDYLNDLQLPRKAETQPWAGVGSFHYGDPPRHGGFEDDKCAAGDTMNSVPVRIIEFWRHATMDEWLHGEKPAPQFVRDPVFEFEFPK
jgi:hypothetical protein